MDLEPIPETTRAVEEFGPFVDGDLLAELKDRGRRVRDVVSECVGLSIASIEEGVTFTLVASDADIAALDAVQYVWGGPYVEGGQRAERVTFEPGVLRESTWQFFAQATAASGVMSTLTLPVVVDEQPRGSVNLYAATTDAFDGHHEELAVIFDAWAPGAVSNADLTFSTRRTAEQAPRIMQEDYRATVAATFIARRDAVEIDEGFRRLHDSARRAGIHVAVFAEYVIEFAGLDDDDDER